MRSLSRVSSMQGRLARDAGLKPKHKLRSQCYSCSFHQRVDTKDGPTHRDEYSVGLLQVALYDTGRIIYGLCHMCHGLLEQME